MSLKEFITTEHDAIRQLLNSAPTPEANFQDWQVFLNQCEESIEANHHQKEEIYIFAAIKDHPGLKSGGPYCGLYFDYHMAKPSIGFAKESILSILNIKAEPDWSSLMQEVKAKNLPLVIPGGDHEAGRMLLKATRAIEADDEKASLKCAQLFSVYKEIQLSHFEREENCFLPMCESLLGQEGAKKALGLIRENFETLT